MGQYIIVLRALLSHTFDSIIMMAMAEMYLTARQHSTVLEEVQHHLIGSVTTVTQLWDALAIYADGAPDDLMNLAVVVEGLTSDVDRDRVRYHAASIIRHKILQKLHRLCAETDEVMFRVWCNVLSATWDIRVASDTTMTLRYGNLACIGWQVAAERLSRQYVQDTDMVIIIIDVVI